MDGLAEVGGQFVIVVDADNAEAVFDRKFFGMNNERIAAEQSGERIIIGFEINVLRYRQQQAEDGSEKKDCQPRRRGGVIKSAAAEKSGEEGVVVPDVAVADGIDESADAQDEKQAERRQVEAVFCRTGREVQTYSGPAQVFGQSIFGKETEQKGNGFLRKKTMIGPKVKKQQVERQQNAQVLIGGGGGVGLAADIFKQINQDIGDNNAQNGKKRFAEIEIEQDNGAGKAENIEENMHAGSDAAAKRGAEIKPQQRRAE